MKEELTAYLEAEPRARERSNKDRAIVNILLKKYPMLAESVPKEVLIGFVKDHNSADRLWRQILEKNPHLRGTDYSDKAALEKEKRMELGYGG